MATEVVIDHDQSVCQTLVDFCQTFIQLTKIIQRKLGA